MNNKNGIAAFLAITAMFGFLSVFAVLGFLPVPPGNKDFFNMGFIALIGCVSTSFGYFLGSSLGSAQKNEMLALGGALEQTPPAAPLINGSADAGYIRQPLLVALLCFALAGFALFQISGCATMQADGPQITAGKSLIAVKATIVTAATNTDRLCKQQLLQADKCMQAKAAYDMAKPAYDSAVDAYLLMSQGGDPAAFGAALLRVQSIAGNMLQLAGSPVEAGAALAEKGGAK